MSKRGTVLATALLAAALLTSACSATVTGFSSPLAHDYGSVQWLPLTEQVEQVFITGPGYADAVANDARTTPAQLQSRWLELPQDARTGDLTELRIGLRLAEDGAEARGAWDTGAQVQLVEQPAADLRFPEGQRTFHEWPETDVWLPVAESYTQSFVSPYANLAGITVRVATFGGDLAAGTATVGPNGAAVLALPLDGESVTTLAAGEQVAVSGAAEGWALVPLPDGGTGYAALESFAELPEPERRASDVLFALRDASGTIVREARVPGSVVHDNAHLTIAFEPVADSGGQTFTLQITSADTAAGNLTLRATATDEYADGARGGDGVSNDLVFRPTYEAAAQPLLDLPVDALPHDGDWIVLDDLPAIPSGIAVALRLIPGERQQAGALQYGVTSDRAPYGAQRASDAAGGTLPGALVMTTVWERDVNVRAILGDGAHNLRGALRDDLPLFAFLATLVIGCGALALALRRSLRLERG